MSSLRFYIYCIYRLKSQYQNFRNKIEWKKSYVIVIRNTCLYFGLTFWECVFQILMLRKFEKFLLKM